MQIFKEIMEKECVILGFFSIIYFKIAYRLSTCIKISDLEIARITLNGYDSMTADARHLCGS